VCNTSPIQYLHQFGLLDLLPKLGRRVCIPPAVIEELAAGREAGVDLPDPTQLDWVLVRRPVSAAALPLVRDLGPGETEVLMLGLESRESILVLDDALARRVAVGLGLRLTGTLGILLSAKRAGLVSAMTPQLDRLQALRFHVAPQTRAAVLTLAGES
jgi:uncharacterized protein